jgi:NAD(P)-dependent dehydrogenase (short-subunit alcohol dehydrogenase family)
MTEHDPGAPVWSDRLAGTVVLVTGAGQSGTGDAAEVLGTGSATALLLALQGACVAIADVSRENAEVTQALVDDAGGDAFVALGDVASPEDCRRMVDEVVGHFGRLDALVNNAAITGGGTAGPDVDTAAWDRVLAVNLTSVMLMSAYAVPHLRVRGGAIVNVSSIAAIRGMGSGAYAASKAGVIGLTADLAYAHGREGIRVNCVVPGHLHTPMGGAGGDQMHREYRRRAGLLGTEGTAWDIAWAVSYLVSPESRWITGVSLPVDAGTTSTTAMPMLRYMNEEPDG